MKVLAIDFETTDKIPEKAEITEVGMVYFDEEWKPFRKKSFYVYAPHYPPQSDEVIRVTGITDAILKEQGVLPEGVLGLISSWMDGADYLIAHNANFDRTVFETAVKKYTPKIKLPPRGKWICSWQDIPYAEHFKCKKLSHLALDHKIHVDPKSLHGAIGDLKCLGDLLREGVHPGGVGYPLKDILAYAKEPWKICVAQTSFDQNALVKERGYCWQDPGNGQIFVKRWVKRLKQNQVKKELDEAPFNIKVEECINA